MPETHASWAACHDCHRDTSGEMTWPGEAGHAICQECWEAECSRSWWLTAHGPEDNEVGEDDHMAEADREADRRDDERRLGDRD